MHDEYDDERERDRERVILYKLYRPYPLLSSLGYSE